MIPKAINQEDSHYSSDRSSWRLTSSELPNAAIELLCEVYIPQATHGWNIATCKSSEVGTKYNTATHWRWHVPPSPLPVEDTRDDCSKEFDKWVKDKGMLITTSDINFAKETFRAGYEAGIKAAVFPQCETRRVLLHGTTSESSQCKHPKYHPGPCFFGDK